MRRTRSLQNAIAFFVAFCCAVILGIPVYEDYSQAVAMAAAQGPAYNPLSSIGTRGLGPLSGLMLFVMSAPMIIMAAPGLAMKLIGVVGGFVISGCVAFVGVMIDNGDTVGASLLGLLAVIALFALFSQGGRMARSRELATRRLATGTVKVIDGTTRQLRRKLGGGSMGSSDDDAPASRRRLSQAEVEELTDPNSSFNMAGMVDRLVLGVVWQAASHKDPQVFAEEVIQGLSEIAIDLENNKVTDPGGHAARAARLYLSRVKAHLNRVRIDPTFGEMMRPTRALDPQSRG